MTGGVGDSTPQHSGVFHGAQTLAQSVCAGYAGSQPKTGMEHGSSLC